MKKMRQVEPFFEEIPEEDGYFKFYTDKPKIGANIPKKDLIPDTKYRDSRRGVHWNREKQKWRACTRIDKKYVHLGYFDSKEEAHIAHQNYIQNFKAQRNDQSTP